MFLLFVCITSSYFNSFSQFISNIGLKSSRFIVCPTPDGKKLIINYINYPEVGNVLKEEYNIENGKISLNENDLNKAYLKFSKDGKSVLFVQFYGYNNYSFGILGLDRTVEYFQTLTLYDFDFNETRFISANEDLTKVLFCIQPSLRLYDGIKKNTYSVNLNKTLDLSWPTKKYLIVHEESFKQVKKMYLKELNSEKPIILIGNTASYAELSPDESKIVVVGNSIEVRRTSDAKIIFTTPVNKSNVAAFSPDNSILVSDIGDKNNSLGVWSVSGEKIQFIKNIPIYGQNLKFLAFTKDGKYLLVASKDYNVLNVLDFNKLIERVESSEKSDLTLPPYLTIESKSISFKDDNDNGLLEANEKAVIRFVVKNSGKGPAKGLRIESRTDVPLKSISISKDLPGDIEAEGRREIVIRLSADANLSTQQNKIYFIVREPNGLDCAPVEINFNSLKYQQPNLVIAEGTVSSEGGATLKQNIPASLQITVTNSGPGIAEKVNFNVSLPSEVLLLSKPFENKTLSAGESVKFKVDFIVTGRYTGTDVILKSNVTEINKKFGASKEIFLKLGESLSVAKFTVASTEESRKVLTVSQDKASKSSEEKIDKSSPYYALIIGISDYKNNSSKLLDLNQPTKDASTIYKTLTDNYTFLKENVYLLKDPTRAELLDMIDNLAKKVTQRDNLLIFYAGHGYWDENLKIGYWLPSDADIEKRSSWISNSSIKDYVSGINSKHTLLVTDACFSGSIFKSRSAESLNTYSVYKLFSSPSRKAMTSGNLTTVPDNSKFFFYINKALLENKDQYLSSRQLFDGIYTSVLNNSSTVPLYGVMQDTGDEGGEFIFIRKSEK